MAKRAKKSGQAKAKKPLSKPRGNRKAGGKKRPGGPRSQALPGHEQIRNQKLDNWCEEIGEARDTINKATASEKEAIASALNEMRRTKAHKYQHAGVVMVFVEGQDKLRVRTTKDKEASGGDGSLPSDATAGEGEAKD